MKLALDLRHLSARIMSATLAVIFVLLSVTPAYAATEMSYDDLKSILNEYTQYEDDGVCTTSSENAISLTGSDNQQKGFNFFVNSGLSDIQAAAIIGNMMQESSMNPVSIQGGGTTKDPSRITVGWGLVQWTPGSKVLGVAENYGITGPIYELATQLQIVLAEMKGTSPTGYNNVYGGLININDLAEAVTFFELNYEGAGDIQLENRIQFARDVLEKYGSTGGSTGVAGNCTTIGAINCNGATVTGASPVRQNIVCVAQAELALWRTRQMKPGTDYHKYSHGGTGNWCAWFASWVFNKAGYPISPGSPQGAVPLVSTIAGGDGGTSHSNVPNGFTYHSADGYIPKPGDMAIYQSGMSHVNIVTSVSKSGNSMTIIGGNQDGPSGYTTSKVTSYTRSTAAVDGLSGYVSPNVD